MSRDQELKQSALCIGKPCGAYDVANSRCCAHAVAHRVRVFGPCTYLEIRDYTLSQSKCTPDSILQRERTAMLMGLDGQFS